MRLEHISYEKIQQNDCRWSLKESRSFSEAEINNVFKAIVVNSQYGKAACITLKDGSFTYVPLKNNSNVAVDDVIDLKKTKLLKFFKKGQPDIYRLEILSDTPKTTQPHLNDYSNWTIKEERPFTEDEIADVKYAVVVLTPTRVSVCILMNNGGATHLPLAPGSSVGVGELVDLYKAKLQVLTKYGESDIHMIFI
jgi:hypothetical protein